jgi:hypothetical protein
MSGVVVVTTVVAANWPVVVQAVTGVAAAMGFGLLRQDSEIEVEQAVESSNRATLEMPESDVFDEVAKDQELVLVRDDARVRVFRDLDGTLKLCVEGSASKAELRRLGEELMGRIAQQYAYHRIMEELDSRGIEVVDQQVTADQTVRVRVKAW